MELMRRMSMYALRQMSCTCASIRQAMTLRPNEREVKFNFFVHLFLRIRRHSVFASLKCNLFSIIQYFTLQMHVST